MYIIRNKYNNIFQYAHFSTHYFLLIDFPLLVWLKQTILFVNIFIETGLNLINLSALLH